MNNQKTIRTFTYINFTNIGFTNIILQINKFRRVPHTRQ